MRTLLSLPVSIVVLVALSRTSSSQTYQVTLHSNVLDTVNMSVDYTGSHPRQDIWQFSDPLIDDASLTYTGDLEQRGLISLIHSPNHEFVSSASFTLDTISGMLTGLVISSELDKKPYQEQAYTITFPSFPVTHDAEGKWSSGAQDMQVHLTFTAGVDVHANDPGTWERGYVSVDTNLAERQFELSVKPLSTSGVGRVVANRSLSYWNKVFFFSPEEYSRKLTITDLLGHACLEIAVVPNAVTAALPLGALIKGPYFARMGSESTEFIP